MEQIRRGGREGQRGTGSGRAAPRGEAGAMCPRGVQETRAGGKAQAGVAKRRGRSSHLSPSAVGGTQDEIRSVRSFKRENKV